MTFKIPGWMSDAWAKLNRAFEAGIPIFYRVVVALALAATPVAILYLVVVLAVDPGNAPIKGSFALILVLFPYYLLWSLLLGVKMLLVPAIAVLAVQALASQRMSAGAVVVLSGAAHSAVAALLIFTAVFDNDLARIAPVSQFGSWGLVAMAGLVGALFVICNLWLMRTRFLYPVALSQSPLPPLSPSR